MKARKLLSLLLAAAMVCSLGITAAAEGVGSDQALMEVTAKVKEALGLDTQRYTDFQGWSNEDLLGKRWNLEWSGDGVSLSIVADDAGKVYSYSLSESVSDSETYYSSQKLRIPSLPQDQGAEALDAAKSFLDKVLTSGVETAELEDTASPSLYRSSYRFSGEIRLNGLSSPITCSVTVRPGDLEVIRFWRGDQSSGYLGELPGPDAKITAEDARGKLRTTLDMEPRYVADEDGKTATVLYVPLNGDEYYVTADGELINLTQLQQNLRSGNSAAGDLAAGTMESAAASEAGSGKELSQAERDGAAILAGVLDKADLDKAVQNAWPEIGLKNYTLASASYSIYEKAIDDGQTRTSEDYDVTCRLVYGKQAGEQTFNKYVTVDAKTGELRSLYSRHSYTEDVPTVSTSVTVGEKAATDLLKSFAGANFDQVELTGVENAKENKSWEHSYTFSQTAYGYHYYESFYTVGVDATDGTISRVNDRFNDEIQLIDPGKVVAKSAAISAYAKALDVQYGYLEVPVSVDLAGSDLRPLLKENGYAFVMSLQPGFVLAQPETGYVRGVDAATGQAVQTARGGEEEKAMTYSDLEGHWVQTSADALAHFSVGFYGGELQPDRVLTQLDMVVLLCSVDGYSFDPTEATQDDLDRLYNHAYSLGLVTPETRDEDQELTRGELVKQILDCGGYDKVAAIPGIFRCTFSDQADISAQDMGYAALAQGLGLVRGGSDGAYAGSRVVTRAEAIAMLYQYMAK